MNLLQVVKIPDNMQALLGELTLRLGGNIVGMYTVEGGRITDVDLIRF